MLIDRFQAERRQLMARAGQCVLMGKDVYALVLLSKALRVVPESEALSTSDIGECLTLIGQLKLRNQQPEAAKNYFRLAIYVYARCATDTTANIQRLTLLLDRIDSSEKCSPIAWRQGGKLRSGRSLSDQVTEPILIQLDKLHLLINRGNFQTAI